MNLPIITQLLGGKSAEAGTTELGSTGSGSTGSGATETGRRGSTLASSFADMIRAALGRRADDEGATKEAAVGTLMVDEAAITPGDGAAFAPTSLLLPDAHIAPASFAEPEANLDTEIITTAGSPSAAEFVVDEDSAEATLGLVPSGDVDADVDEAAIAGRANVDGRSLAPRSGANIAGVESAADSSPSDEATPVSPFDVDGETQPGRSAQVGESGVRSGTAQAARATNSAPEMDAVGATEAATESSIDVDAPRTESAAHSTSTGASSGRTDAAVADFDVGQAEAEVFHASTQTRPSGVAAGSADSGREPSEPNSAAKTSGTESGSSRAVAGSPAQADRTVAEGSAPDARAGGLESAIDPAPITASRNTSTGSIEAAHPGRTASMEMNAFTATAADTIAAELADIVDSQGKAVIEATDNAEEAGRASAPSQPDTKPEGAAARRPFVVVDARIASNSEAAELADASKVAGATDNDLTANVQFDEVSGEVTTNDAASSGASAAPEPAAVPSEHKQAEARSTDTSTDQSTSTVAAPIRDGDESSAGSGGDPSGNDRGNQFEAVTSTPAGNDDISVEEDASPFEIAADAPLEVADEASLRGEDPLQTLAHRTADAAATTSRAGQTAPAGRSSMQAAWLRAMMEQAPGAVTTASGWSSLTVSLDDSDGTMTVEARRDERHVAVQVSFSDPNLRSIAAQNLERLEAALRAQYDASVDLSLTSDGQGGGANSETSDGRPAARSNAPQEPASAARTARSVPLGATREWVG